MEIGNNQLETSFNGKIDKINQELQQIYHQNLKKFPNQPVKQAEIVLRAMNFKMGQLINQVIQNGNREEFNQYLAKEVGLSLKDKGREKFLSRIKEDSKKIIKQIFTS